MLDGIPPKKHIFPMLNSSDDGPGLGLVFSKKDGEICQVGLPGWLSQIW